MSRKRAGIIIGIAVVAAAAIGIGGFFLRDKLSGGGGSSGDKVYVQSVAELMNNSNGNQNRFNGTVESQETYEVKVDSSRTIKEVNVAVGDEVKTGDTLLSYDTDDLSSQVKQGKLDLEGMQDEIDNYNRQINSLSAERDKAADSDKFEYTTQIQTIQNNIQQKKYDMESKQLEIDKLNKQIEESVVVSKVDGVVKEINENQTDEYGNEKAFMTVMQTGDYRIKGSIDEQNIWSISEGQTVIIRSRVDNETTWTGSISKIDTENQIQDNNIYMSSDSGEKASRYPFYIQLDSTDGLILGQHVYVELDNGQEEVKEGIWLYSSYIVMDDGDPYVWADNGKGKIEKRTVELGEYDEMLAEYEIVSGLTEEDLITYPMSGLYEGVATVTNEEEVDYSSPLYTESGGDEMLDDFGTEMMDEMYPDAGMMDEMISDTEMMDEMYPDAGMTDGMDADAESMDDTEVSE